MNGVNIEFDGMTLASILDVPEENDSEEVTKEEDNYSEENQEEDASLGESTPDVYEKEHSDSETKEEVAKKSSESVEDFYDVVDENTVAPDEHTHDAPAQSVVQQRGKSKARGVEPSSTIPDSDLLHLQAELDHALKDNARF
ncbi:hypothetical protein Dimus_026360 [Dionaea muscipula]